MARPSRQLISRSTGQPVLNETRVGAHRTLRQDAQMIRGSVARCVGETPLVRLNRCFSETDVEVLAKLELMNPLGSVKDRPARFIIETGLQKGWIRAGAHVVESTSGNLGIALAAVCPPAWALLRRRRRSEDR